MLKLIIFILTVLSSTIIINATNLNEMDTTSLREAETVSLESINVELVDSVVVAPKTGFNKMIGDITNSRAYKMTNIAVPLIAGGLIMKVGDEKFRSLRNEYTPQFSEKYDDYLQYLPAAVLLGLKVGGVKGRSSWGRMLVSDAFTVAIMAGAVNSIKRIAKVDRPDGSNNHSFPSGHTATAFMCATLLHKEYGKVSPWYSIGGYAVATATGVSRILNNKHWISDVMVGAGIGILSAELGYFFADLIFKKNGLNEFKESSPFDRSYKPSFLGLYVGYNVAPSTMQISNSERIGFRTGANAGIEGAMFFNPYIGVGGRVTFTSMPIMLNGIEESNMLGVMNAEIGPYISYPLCSQILVGAKLIGGYVDYKQEMLSSTTIGGNGGFACATGISVTLLGSRNFSVKLFTDYNLQQSVSQDSGKTFQYLTVGGVGSINF